MLDGQMMLLPASPVNLVLAGTADVMLMIASPVVSVVKVPLTASALSYLHSTLPGNVVSKMNVIFLAASEHVPPRTWNSSSAMVGVDLRHQGVPLETDSPSTLTPACSPLVVMVKPGKTLTPVHSFIALYSGPVPEIVAVVMFPSNVPALFLVTAPVSLAVVHSVRVVVPSPFFNSVFPTFVARILVPVANAVPVGCVMTGLFAADAAAGRATARTAKPRQDVMNFLLMGCFL